MAGSNKRCWEVCEWLWFVSEDEEQNRGTSRKVEAEWGTRETMDTSNGGLYYKVTISS